VDHGRIFAFRNLSHHFLLTTFLKPGISLSRSPNTDKHHIPNTSPKQHSEVFYFILFDPSSTISGRYDEPSDSRPQQQPLLLLLPSQFISMNLRLTITGKLAPVPEVPGFSVECVGEVTGKVKGKKRKGAQPLLPSGKP